jgi:hypothetical protein
MGMADRLRLFFFHQTKKKRKKPAAARAALRILSLQLNKPVWANLRCKKWERLGFSWIRIQG